MTFKIIEGLLWSLGGLVVGYALCWYVTESSMRSGKELSMESLRMRRMEVFRAILGVVILVMVLISSIRYYQVTSCQTEYNVAVANALRERSTAQGETSDAQIALLTVQNPNRDPVIAKQAIDRYIASLLELERVRKANPLPEPPDCGAF